MSVRDAAVQSCALALAALAGATTARGSAWALALAPAALAAHAVALRRAVGHAVRAGSVARDDLRAVVAARNEELERRGAELASSVRQLELARTHLGVADRLAAVGRLAGGVAHEVNNVLAIALTNIGWVREHLAGTEAEGDAVPTAELVTALREAEEASQRAARSIRDLQDFAQDRGGRPRLAPRHDDPARPRVLVLDDEPLVCASLHRLLSRRFEVVPQTSPLQALRLLRAGERFDAVLCDLMMPELSGPDFFDRLQQARPELASRVVFLTGGAFTDGTRAFLDRTENPRLQKPCDSAELVAVLSARCPGPIARAG